MKNKKTPELAAEARDQVSQLVLTFSSQHEQLRRDVIAGFGEFFRKHPPQINAPGYKHIVIKNSSSFDEIPSGNGLYLIASNFVPELEKANQCRLKINKLPVIYRGQAANVRERVQSHLQKDAYLDMKAKKEQAPWIRCMKLDKLPGNGGINFDGSKFSSSKWEVLVLPIPNSRTAFRDCAEWAFDEIYGKPIASNERARAPGKLD